MHANRTARTVPSTPVRGGVALAAGALLALLAPGTAAGQDGGPPPRPGPGPGAEGAPGPLVTDRPDRTESASVVPPGFVQLEAGWTFTRATGEVEDEDAHALPETLVRVGVLPWLEARLAFDGWIALRRESPSGDVERTGVGDAEVGLKARIARGDGGRPEVALLGALSVPTGEEGFGSQRADPSVRLAAGHELGPRISLGYNAGVVWSTVTDEAGDPSTATEMLYTVAAGMALGGGLGAFVEGFGFVGLDDRGATRHLVDGGLTLLLADGLQLDGSAGFGLDDDAEDWFAGAGVSLRLPR